MISIPRFLRHKSNINGSNRLPVDAHSPAALDVDSSHDNQHDHHHHHHHMHPHRPRQKSRSHSIPTPIPSSRTEAVRNANKESRRSSTAILAPLRTTGPTSITSRSSTMTIYTPTPIPLPTPPTTPPSPQFTLLAHHAPPTWTIALLLEELGLPYAIIPVGVRGANSADLDFLGLNSVDSDMRVPALVDHSNRDLVLVETGAVVMYLVERYGVPHAKGRSDGGLCPQDEEGKALARQWLFFGLTDFSPAFTTASHFLYEHPQKLPTAITHTTTLVHRALSTLDSALSASKSGYLVPGAQGPTYADLVCWSWGWVYESGGFPALVDGDGYGYGDEGEGDSDGDGQGGDCWQRYPNVGRWQRRMNERESAKRVVVKWEELKLEYV